MLQTFFHIPSSMGGIAVFGFGLLLGLWAVFSVGLLAWLVWRQGWCADTWSYVPLLAIVAAAIAWLLPAISDEEGLPIRAYGVMLLLGVLAGTGLTILRGRRLELSADAVITLVFWMFIPGIVGARVFYVIEYWGRDYQPVFAQAGFFAGMGAVLNVASGGLVVYGSLIGGLAGVWAFARRMRWPALAVGDLLIPGMVLGLAIGRIGCLLNGCCYGGLCDLPWAVTFPERSFPYNGQVGRGLMYGFDIGGPRGDAPAVGHVHPDSPAESAGLRQGDRLASINGQTAATTERAQELLRRLFYDRRPLTIQTGDDRQVHVPAADIPPRSLKIHPSQAYSAINALVLCLLLLAYDPFARRNGELLALGLTIYPITRFLLEMIRTDEAPIFGTGMSISQNVSLLMLAGVGALWWWVLKAGEAKGSGFGVGHARRAKPQAAL